ncbi:MAG: hypothetical protein WDZ63_09570 [Burkholderiales bacterium]
MKKSILNLAGVMLFCAGPAFGLNVEANVEGPLLTKQRAIELVRQKVGGEVAQVPDVGQGGNHRLYVRVVSQHVGPGSRFLYFVDIQLQRRVLDYETGRIYWAWTQTATSWGTVPSETELREAVVELMDERVKTWKPD